jgi:hypothetical protein
LAAGQVEFVEVWLTDVQPYVFTPKLQHKVPFLAELYTQPAVPSLARNDTVLHARIANGVVFRGRVSCGVRYAAAGGLPWRRLPISLILPPCS